MKSFDEIAPVVSEKKYGEASVKLTTQKKQNIFYFRAINRPNIMQLENLCNYAQVTEIQINPIMFH
jgi:hypothetical protein